MNFQLINHPLHPYLECLPEGGMLENEQAALDVVAACGENNTDRVLIPAACLPEAFFQLRSGLAGAVMLKFSNYRIRAALVVPPEQAKAGRFGEMAQEINRGRELHIADTRDAAERWLESLE